MSDGKPKGEAAGAEPVGQQGGQGGEKDKQGAQQAKPSGAPEAKSGSEQGKQPGTQANEQDRQAQSSQGPMQNDDQDLSYPFIVWFDVRMQDMHDDLQRRQFSDVPQTGHIDFNPFRRSRFFDALLAPDHVNPQCVFHVNPNKNQVECELSTGCGEFFRPEDIEVNLKDRNVEVVARREMKSDENYTMREFRRVVTVPETADIEKLNAEMKANGRILLTAPLLKPVEKKSDKPRAIKINRQ